MIHHLLGVRIDDFSAAEIETKLEDWLLDQGGHTIVTPNAEFLLEARKNDAFKSLLNHSDLAMADSVSLQYAAAALSETRLAHRLPGVELLENLCAIASRRRVSVLLLGGAPSCAEASAQKLRQRFETLDISAIDPGQISWQGNALVVSEDLLRQINVLAPSIIAVALGSHKQEQFMAQIRTSCPSVKIWIGVGGAFEMISGQKKRAPRWLSNVGLEWLWRLMIEPRRWRRIFNASIVFPLVVAREAFRRKTFLQSTHNVFTEIRRQWTL
ncbi:MAG: Glycosyl transferase, WecB/TagA/CpsF family [Candidatus Uhrbacteria bacterium GW2011_GWA2_52_8d]|uniref:Glycosyl transferase, WecB/TagA/CpsF family n=1 Tax=Candidatus Uhrbacteria bacterium GW2011_GWA2_52_8d TaxID=1618979 RepID=A0A0G1ZS18_9BACT|nr:MAG: Glycosyl transferase, WecB/TagA/CpsF family [Candidatus Uhrbacteria bacterium GW2011_GWA2_52_8d]